MERTISQEERIRRANEIYYRRNQNKNHYTDNIKRQVEIPAYKKAKKSMTKKLVMQSVVCIIIYFVVYYMQGSNVESVVKFDDVKQKINNDVNVEMLKENFFKAKDWILTKLNGIVKDDTARNEEANMNQSNEEISANEENIAAKEEDKNLQEETQNVQEEYKNAQKEAEIVAQEATPKTQEEIDIEAAKEKNIIWPLNGVITSGFGQREGNEIVSSNHKGLDIAGNQGDNIIASMAGIVTLASTEGDYRKTYKNRKWRCDNTLCTL